ncbi:hypothetical protein M408DRAFT_10024 [Serendipita vermifera MAFF 305830]|uniref:Uncharacterized protein n=1 Tax=Serendipita vermifera MAFF 305830 TaxID=933852 RepID=A0A0C3ANN0_SERVB|nr:hypothetical protein M408DRAFT_10024 [Serendipita vermifera MAFF 305830]
MQAIPFMRDIRGFNGYSIECNWEVWDKRTSSCSWRTARMSAVPVTTRGNMEGETEYADDVKRKAQQDSNEKKCSNGNHNFFKIEKRKDGKAVNVTTRDERCRAEI